MRTSRRANRCRSRARSPSTGSAARSSRASRATTTSWWGSVSRCCVRCSPISACSGPVCGAEAGTDWALSPRELAALPALDEGEMSGWAEEDEAADRPEARQGPEPETDDVRGDVVGDRVAETEHVAGERQA